MNEKQQLDKHSRNFFISGLFISRLSFFGPKIVSVIAFLLSAILYLAGYISWLLSTNYSHEAKDKIVEDLKDHYEQQYKNLPQYFVASIVGIIASILLFSSLWLPLIGGIMSCWLYVISNTFWCWAEQINLKRLLQEQTNALLIETKENYFSYASLTTFNSILVASSVTICLLLPTIALPVGLVFSTFILAMNVHMFHYWAKTLALTLQLTDGDLEQDSIELSQTYTKLQARQDFTKAPNTPKIELDPNVIIQKQEIENINSELPKPLEPPNISI